MFATTRAITHARETRAVNATANSRRRTGRVVVARAAETTKEQKVRAISIRSGARVGPIARARMDGWMDGWMTRGRARRREGRVERGVDARRKIMSGGSRAFDRSFDRSIVVVRSFVRPAGRARARDARGLARGRGRRRRTTVARRRRGGGRDDARGRRPTTSARANARSTTEASDARARDASMGPTRWGDGYGWITLDESRLDDSTTRWGRGARGARRTRARERTRD